jgi:transposase
MKYQVELWEEVGGYAYIEANSKEEAYEKAQQILDDEGMEGFDNKINTLDTTYRSIDVFDVIEQAGDWDENNN